MHGLNWSARALDDGEGRREDDGRFDDIGDSIAGAGTGERPKLLTYSGTRLTHHWAASHGNAQRRRDSDEIVAPPVSHEQLCEQHDPSTSEPPRPPFIANASRLMAASLDPSSALCELTRLVHEHHQCRCIVDVTDPTTSLRVADAPTVFSASQRVAFAALLAEVADSGAAVVATAEALDDSAVHRAAQHARDALDVSWVACAPLTTDTGEVLGTVTTFGDDTSDLYMTEELAREVGRDIARALEKVRLFTASQQATQQREQVLALVAHELGNPLSAIVLAASRALDPGSTARRCGCATRELEAIQRAARRMKKLVSDLLDLASLDSGSLSMAPSACNLGTLVGDVVRELGPIASAAGITVVEALSEDLPVACVDGDRIAQVLVNLLSNALKFTPRGGQVCVRAARVDSSAILVAVEDCGRGIAPEHIDRIFDRFWQAAETASLGSGLGLAICQSIVQLAGGRIWVKSRKGIGTTVYFTVPTLA